MQNEYSMLWRGPERDVIPACEELGIGFVPWSPLGVQFLTGWIDANTRLAPGDIRGAVPRSTPENRKANRAVVDLVRAITARKGVAHAQLALAWVLARWPWIVPIPGTTKLHRLEEHLGAADVELTQGVLRELDAAALQLTVHRQGYSEGSQRMIDC